MSASLVALPLLVLAAFAPVVACGNKTIIETVSAAPGDDDDSGAGDDAGIASLKDAAPDSSPTPAPVPTGISFPHVESRGGSTIATPKVVPIVFAGDAMEAQITDFTSKLAVSDFWKTQASEYGVGPITAGKTISLSESAPTTIGGLAIESWLQNKITSGAPGFSAADPNTLYAIYYPATTTITDDGQGLGQSCTGYGGYHYETTVGTTKIGYAVLPRCNDLDDLTVASSHEFFEWATDPFPLSNPAFNKLDDDHWAWGITMLGELGDLCTFLDRDFLTPADVGYQIQRMWSNKASLGGIYPCAPNGTRPYYTAITTATDEVEVPDTQDQSVMLTTKAVNVPPGTSRSVDVLIYSDKASTASVPLRALSYADFGMSSTPSGFTYTLSKDYANVGETIQVTITSPTAEGSDFLVMTAYTSDQTALYWPVLVVNEPAALRAPSHAPTAIKRSPIPFTKLGMAKQALPALAHGNLRD